MVFEPDFGAGKVPPLHHLTPATAAAARGGTGSETMPDRGLGIKDAYFLSAAEGC